MGHRRERIDNRLVEDRTALPLRTKARGDGSPLRGCIRALTSDPGRSADPTLTLLRRYHKTSNHPGRSLVFDTKPQSLPDHVGMSNGKNLASSRQLLDGAVAAIENARRLVSDAKKLRNSGSAPTGYALAVLAMEKASKAFSWVITAKSAATNEQTIEVPSEGHPQRLLRVQLVLETMRQHFHETSSTSEKELIQRAIELARIDNLAKQRGFYVDLKNGHVQDPNEIQPDAASEICETAEGIIGLAMIGMIYPNSRVSD